MRWVRPIEALGPHITTNPKRYMLWCWIKMQVFPYAHPRLCSRLAIWGVIHCTCSLFFVCSPCASRQASGWFGIGYGSDGRSGSEGLALRCGGPFSADILTFLAGFTCTGMCIGGDE